MSKSREPGERERDSSRRQDDRRLSGGRRNGEGSERNRHDQSRLIGISFRVSPRRQQDGRRCNNSRILSGSDVSDPRGSPSKSNGRIERKVERKAVTKAMMELMNTILVKKRKRKVVKGFREMWYPLEAKK
jgi:hypothetical protein